MKDGAVSPLQRFCELFNAGEYFESHEVLEDHWREQGKPPLYQGLIQAAVCQHHLRRENRRGAAAQARKALANLSGYGPVAEGLPLEELRRYLAEVLEQLDTGGSLDTGPPPRLEIRPR